MAGELSLRKSVSVPHETLRSLLSDAIIELCRREAFYVEELRIEGTVCVVSDRSSALIVQITEQVGNKTTSVTHDAYMTGSDGQLPTIDNMTTKLNSCPSASETQTTSCAGAVEGTTGPLAMKQCYIRRRLRSCRHCGAHFIRLGSLQSHIRRRHPLAVLSTRRKGLTSFMSSSESGQPAATACNNVGSRTDVSFSRNSDATFNQNMLLNAMKSEPGFPPDSLAHGFPADLNLGLQQMVRTLSMMSSLPINNNSHHFPPSFSVASSGNSCQADDDPVVELRRSADGKFACPYCTKTYGFKHSLKEHIDVHRGRRPHVCRHCGASFAHLASLCAHIRRRHDDRMPAEFRCSLCGEKLMNLQSLKQHRTWRHKDAPRLSDPIPATPNDLSSPPPPTMPISSTDHLLGGTKKDSGQSSFSHGQRSVTTPWSSPVFPGASGASCTSVDLLQSKLQSSAVNTRAPLITSQHKDTVATATDIPSFDSFEFHSFLPSVNDFQPVSGAASWSAGHVTTPGISDTTNCHGGQMSAPAAHQKFFSDTPELPGHSQSGKTQSSLQYRPSDGMPDPYFMTAVCPICNAKFRTESEYRRHVACNPNHVTLSWRQ